MIIRILGKKIWTISLVVILLVNSTHCFTLTPIERAIISAFTALTDIRNDFARHFLEALSLPVLAPILVKSGALLGEKTLSPNEVEEQLRNAGIGTVLHGLSLLPITLPVSAVHLLSAPMAVPYRRRVGRGLEYQLRKDIAAVVSQLHQLAQYTDKQAFRLNYINVVPQNTLEHSTLDHQDKIPPLVIPIDGQSESIDKTWM